MIDNDKALVERLRDGVLYGDARLHNPKGHDPLRMEAADRIEALSAENERLREDLAFMEKALVKADELVKHAIRLAEVYERATLAGKK